MAIPGSGAIAISTLQGEFGNRGNSLSNYYGVDDGVPTGGTISLGHFYNTLRVTPGSWGVASPGTFYVGIPQYHWITIDVRGGGGGGGSSGVSFYSREREPGGTICVSRPYHGQNGYGAGASAVYGVPAGDFWAQEGGGGGGGDKPGGWTWAPAGYTGGGAGPGAAVYGGGGGGGGLGGGNQSSVTRGGAGGNGGRVVRTFSRWDGGAPGFGSTLTVVIGSGGGGGPAVCGLGQNCTGTLCGSAGYGGGSGAVYITWG